MRLKYLIEGVQKIKSYVWSELSKNPVVGALGIIPSNKEKNRHGQNTEFPKRHAVNRLSYSIDQIYRNRYQSLYVRQGTEGCSIEMLYIY